jgi:ribonuclease HII
VSAWRRLARAEARLAGDAATVVGVDEAGRGPLAGPVVAAAVVLASRTGWRGLDDSKKVPPELRQALYARVLAEARAFSWSVIGSRAIDRMNIRRASLEAMRRAVVQLRLAPDLVLVDGLDCVPGLDCRQQAVIAGDGRMLSIAAASIVAKVVRDRIMERLDRVWPDYGFVHNKGYGTPEHIAILTRRGPCPIHRYSYAPVRLQELPLFDDPVAVADAVAAGAGRSAIAGAAVGAKARDGASPETRSDP